MGSPIPGGEEEREWIRRSQGGDREAFGWLAERHRRRVFSVVYHLVRRRDEVEDLAQEVLLKAFQGIRSYNFQASFGTWLARITVNHCYDYLRRERTSRLSYYWQMTEEAQRDLEARLASPEAGGLTTEQQAVLRDLTAQLLQRAPTNDRILLVLKELEELSIEEIAEILKIRTGTVKVRLHRARKRMLEDLRRWRQGR